MTVSHGLAPTGWFSFEDRSVGGRAEGWRGELRQVLRAHLGNDRADDVLLAASELVSNGAEHGGGVQCLRVRGEPGTVTVEVEDGVPRMLGRRASRPRRGRGLDFRGRGLDITDSVADAWGWHSIAAGKVVWARFGSPNHRRGAG